MLEVYSQLNLLEQTYKSSVLENFKFQASVARRICLKKHFLCSDLTEMRGSLLSELWFRMALGEIRHAQGVVAID